MAPWLALLVALTAVFGLPTLVKWFQDGTWRDGLYVDRDRSPWLDLLLAAAVTATVFAARDTHVSGVWYATVWWHLACLVAVVAFVFWRCDVDPSHVRQLLTTGGEPRHIRNVGYALICVVAAHQPAGSRRTVCALHLRPAPDQVGRPHG